MNEKLLKTIEKNKIILILTEDNVIKNIQESLSQHSICKIICINIFEPSQIEDLSQKEKYYFIFSRFGEDEKFENIFIRYRLDRFDAKIIIICQPSLIAHYRDPSLYFVPIKNGLLQKNILQYIIQIFFV